MSLAKLNVKKGDTVLVLSGKDKGKQGKVIEAQPKKGKVIVEGVNKVKRHTKPSQSAPQGGIITKEAPLFASKVQLVCPPAVRPRASHTASLTGARSVPARSAAKRSSSNL